MVGKHNHIIFLCDRNTARSPMAASILKQYKPDLEISSAGITPDDLVDPFAAGAMHKIGINITEHVPQALNHDKLGPDTILIALSMDAYQHLRSLRKQHNFELEYWDLPIPPTHDGPREMIASGYETIANALEKHISNRFT